MQHSEEGGTLLVPFLSMQHNAPSLSVPFFQQNATRRAPPSSSVPFLSTQHNKEGASLLVHPFPFNATQRGGHLPPCPFPFDATQRGRYLPPCPILFDATQ